MLVYDARALNTNKTNTISTALAVLLMRVEFKASLSASHATIDLYDSNDLLMQEFSAACNGKVSLSLNGRTVPGKTIDLINSQEFSNIAELYSALGSDITFRHVSDDTYNSVWTATFKIAVADGQLPLGENMTLNLSFEGFSNAILDVAHSVYRDMNVTVYSLSAPNRATYVHKLKNFTTKNGQVTEIDLSGVHTFAVPSTTVKTNSTFYGDGFQQEMLQDERESWLYTDARDRINSMGVTAPWYNWHVFASNDLASVKVTAASEEKCYGFMIEPIL